MVEGREGERRRALVLGSTGLVGARCVAHLVESPVYERVTCLVRRPSWTTSDKLREHVVDFARLTAADIGPCDDLYCAIGSTMKKAGSREAFRHVDLEIPLEVARLATSNGGLARVALVSSVGADTSASSLYLRTKGELEDALAKLPLEELHVMRPSLLLGDRVESRPGEKLGTIVANATSWMLVGCLRKVHPVDVDVVARAMVGALSGPRRGERVQIHHYDEILALAAATTMTTT